MSRIIFSKNAIKGAILSSFGVMKYMPFCFLALTVYMVGCVKAPQYPSVPQIEFLSVSSSYIRSGDLDTIMFSFTDGEGDIGVNPTTGDTCNQCGLKNGDSTCLGLRGFNIFLIDSRDTCVGTFASGSVEQEGIYDDVSGEIIVIRNIDTKKCFVAPMPGCPKDTVVYTILLRDKAGNFSNPINTSEIVIDGE